MPNPKTARDIIIQAAGGLVPVSSQSFANPVKDEKTLKQLLVSSEQVILDAADQIIAALPGMHPHSIEDILQSISTVSKKLWFLRAECVAELLRRQEPHLGGRSQRAAPGEGRNDFVKEWAKKLAISPTKLREDIRIVEVFSTRLIRNESGKLQSPPDYPDLDPQSLVLSEEEKNRIEATLPGFRQTVELTRDGEFIEDVGYTDASGNVLYAAHFSPNPLLNRQYYVVLSKMDNWIKARSKLREVEQRLEAGEPLTAKALYDEIFIKSDRQGGFFKMRQESVYDRANIKFTMTSEDFAIFNKVVEQALEFKDFKLHGKQDHLNILSKSGDGYKIIIQAFRAYLSLLKSDPQNWKLKSSFNPANFTPERMKIRQEAAALASQKLNRYRREKKLLDQIEAELKEKFPKAEPGGETWEAHKEQLIIVKLAEDAVEAALKSFKEEENFQLQQITSEDSADEEKTDLTDH